MPNPQPWHEPRNWRRSSLPGRSRDARAAAVLAPLVLAGLILSHPPACAALEEKVEYHQGGKPSAKYTVDEAGRRHGAYREYFESGKVRIAAEYREGALHGRQVRYFESGKAEVRCEYRHGKLHGPYREKDERGKLLISAQYEDGLLHGEYETTKPGKVAAEQIVEAQRLLFVWGQLAHPKPLGYIRDRLAEIDPHAVLAEDKPLRKTGRKSKKRENDPDSKAGKGMAGADRHQRALERLHAYRFLCDIPYADVVLDEELNRYGKAGAEICAAIGKLDHMPANPGWPEDRYNFAYHAASHSNLSMGSGSDLALSVDRYMCDSDPSNIDRVGHRRWCLNPQMLKVGWGSSGRFSSMMAHDSSRTPPHEWDTICYPARGYMPLRYFSAAHAWCLLLNPVRFAEPDKGGVKAAIFPLEREKLQRAEQPLAQDYFNVETTKYGKNWAVIFRPRSFSPRNGDRYWVEIDGLSRPGGEAVPIRYLVEFTDLTRAPQKR